MKYGKPNCPVCNGTNISKWGVKSNYQLYLCGDCDLLFVFPTPGEEEISAVYSSLYYKNEDAAQHGYSDYDKDKEPMRAVFEKYLTKLAELVEGRKLFDIGAATGYFLDIAKEHGWETAGSEISAYAAEEARRRGHSMIQGALIDEHTLPRADVVTAWDVFEHVVDPVAYVRAVNQMLPLGGVIAINTIDRSSWWARVFGMHWHMLLPPEHLTYFSPKNLRILLARAGFEVLEFKKVGKSFSPTYIFKMLATWQQYSLWSFFARITDNAFFRYFSIPINLRDNVFVLARKINELES